MTEEHRADWEAKRAAALADVGAPVFGIEGPGWFSGFGRGNGGVRVVMTYRNGASGLQVETNVGGRDTADAALLTRWFIDRFGFEPVSFPLEIRVDRWETELDVAGRRVPFVFVGETQAWAAYGRWDVGRAIEVLGRGVDPRALALVIVEPGDYPER